MYLKMSRMREIPELQTGRQIVTFNLEPRAQKEKPSTHITEGLQKPRDLSVALNH
jgi:hypothetical protein